MVCQFTGWFVLQDAGIKLSNNTSGAFMYVLTGLHVAHIIIGLGAMSYIFADALKNAAYVDGFIQSLNPIKKARLQLVTRYWHFVDLLWLFLFGLFTLS
jgi:cytochrome c oxidase subunit III